MQASEKITILRSADQTSVLVKAGGWTVFYVFLLLFAIAWNGAVCFFFFYGDEDPTLLVPFAFLGFIILLLLLYRVFGKTMLVFTATEIRQQWLLFGLRIGTKRSRQQLERIEEGVDIKDNSQPVYNITLYFRNEKKLTLGSHLKDVERAWLIGELKAIAGFAEKSEE